MSWNGATAAFSLEIFKNKVDEGGLGGSVG